MSQFHKLVCAQGWTVCAKCLFFEKLLLVKKFGTGQRVQNSLLNRPRSGFWMISFQAHCWNCEDGTRSTWVCCTRNCQWRGRHFCFRHVVGRQHHLPSSLWCFSIQRTGQWVPWTNQGFLVYFSGSKEFTYNLCLSFYNSTTILILEDVYCSFHGNQGESIENEHNCIKAEQD